jgi:serine/threonine protein kinase
MDRRHRISDLHHAALARPPEERGAFLRDACDANEALRQEVESLLQFEPASAQFLETPAANAVAARASMVKQQIGPYTIVAPLGAGGMGEVYRARQQARARRGDTT